MTDQKKGSRPASAKPAAPAKTPAKADAIKKPAKAKTAAAAKPAVSAKPAKAALGARARAKKPAAVSPDQRRNYIEVAAYYIAAGRGFAPGDPLQDWIQAEAEIDRLLGEGRLGNLGT